LSLILVRQIIFMLLIVSVINGCGHIPQVSLKANAPSPKTSQSLPSPEPQVLQATIKSKEIPADEFTGVVYNDQLLKDLQYSDIDGVFSLAGICQDLQIPMIKSENPPQYKDIVVPYQIRLSYEKVTVTVMLDTSNKETMKHLNSEEAADAAYIVRKNGKLVQMKLQPFVHHGSGPYINLEELLELLEIEHTQKGQLLLIGIEQSALNINSKLLFQKKIKPAGKIDENVRLIYEYDLANKPYYKRIVLQIGDEPIILLDQNHKGSSNYYQGGYIEVIPFNGEDFLQVHLDEDTMIFKKNAGGWKLIFSNEQYKQYQEGSLTLKTSFNGTALFVDSINKVEKKVNAVLGAPNTLYKMQVQSMGYLNLDERQQILELTADLAARNEGRTIFIAHIHFVYNGETLIPKEITSLDDYKLGTDKSNGKNIISTEEYLQFDYLVP
jgi:hypothetical protein